MLKSSSWAPHTERSEIDRKWFFSIFCIRFWKFWSSHRSERKEKKWKHLAKTQNWCTRFQKSHPNPKFERKAKAKEYASTKTLNEVFLLKIKWIQMVQDNQQNYPLIKNNYFVVKPQLLGTKDESKRRNWNRKKMKSERTKMKSKATWAKNTSLLLPTSEHLLPSHWAKKVSWTTEKEKRFWAKRKISIQIQILKIIK